jgi:hypothetical protein
MSRLSILSDNSTILRLISNRYVFYPQSTSVMVKALCYKPEGRGFETGRNELFLLNFLVLPAALGPAAYSVYNRNKYQKQKNNVFRGRRLRLTNLPPSVSRLSRQCGILTISQPYKGPRAAMRITELSRLLSSGP